MQATAIIRLGCLAPLVQPPLAGLGSTERVLQRLFFCISTLGLLWRPRVVTLL